MCQGYLSHYMTSTDPSTKNVFQTEGFGAAAPWVDLANSDMRNGFGVARDLLDDPAWIRAFLTRWNFQLTRKDNFPVARLRALRDSLRSLVEKAGKTAELRNADIAELNAWLNVAAIPQLVKNQNGFELRLQAALIGWPAIIASIAETFAQSLMEGKIKRLKFCANEGCRWVFIDRTKGNIRRWCNDATCGNRDRVRRSRASLKRKTATNT
jgi:predicted RNA-binding Zn ribbon-like protein